jgi:hypothetical protein
MVLALAERERKVSSHALKVIKDLKFPFPSLTPIS